MNPTAPFNHLVIDYYDGDPSTGRVRATFLSELDATDFANSVAVMLDVRARAAGRSFPSIILSYDVRTDTGRHHHPAIDLHAFTATDRQAVHYALKTLRALQEAQSE